MSRLDEIEIQRLRDVAEERIVGHRNYIQEGEELQRAARARLQQQSPLEKADIDRVLDPLRAAIAIQEARLSELEDQRQSLVLRTDISGQIVPTTAPSNVAAAQPILAIPGQQVRAGTVLFTIAGDQPEYIVSYVRPSQRLQPAVGMQVSIRPRNSTEAHQSYIERVGPQLELVPTHHLRDQKVTEWGVPVRIHVPGTLELTPGELVDLRFLPGTQPLPQPSELVTTRGQALVVW